MEVVQRINVAGTLKLMEPGQVWHIALDTYNENYVRTKACNIGRALGRKYRVSRMRGEPDITITRIA